MSDINKLSIQERFVTNKSLTNEEREFFIALLNKSDNYKLNLKEYVEVYNSLPHIKGKISNIDVYANFTDTEVVLNKTKLRELGIWIKKSKVPENVDFNKLSKLLIEYNKVRCLHYQKKGFSVRVVTQEDESPVTFNKLISFLEEYKIEDWYLFFYSLFVSTNWGIVWSLKACYSSKALDLYNNNRTKALEEIGMSKLADTLKDQKSEWIDIFEHIEERKARLINKDEASVCKARKEDFLGYHPKSVVCNKCPVKAACAMELVIGFQALTKTDIDIIQLRSGSMTKAQAQKKLEEQGTSFEL